MTKDVLITISGVQMLDDDDEDVEMVTRGDYYQKNGKHYIMYDEQMEGFEGTVKNIIKVSPDSVDIIKKGITSAHMQFEKNKKKLSCYNTPLGDPGEPDPHRRGGGLPEDQRGVFAGYQLPARFGLQYYVGYSVRPGGEAARFTGCLREVVTAQ